MKLTNAQLTVVLDALDQRIKQCNETIEQLKNEPKTSQTDWLIDAFVTIRNKADSLATKIDEQEF